MPVVRDSDGVEREYGREKWSAVERSLDEVTTREGDFGRILSAFARAERYPDGPLERVEALLGGSRGEVPAAVALGGYLGAGGRHGPGPMRGGHRPAGRAWVGVRSQRPVRLVAERPWSARHVAVEHTEAGLRVATRLGAMARELSANLAKLLHGRAEAGDITLGRPVLEAVGVNPANATTIVAWRVAP